MRAVVTHHVTGTTVTIAGQLDLATAAGLRGTLLNAVTDAVAAVTVDLAGVDHLGCAGIGALAEGRHHAAGRGIALRVRAAGPHLTRLFQLTDTADLLDPRPAPT
ncbi:MULTISPECIES: STAS domain-containing protein [Catenuloplanes]|uniref:Anti-sigma B factor antagonist n=1 Tax=Catenuloplanes niger TaxID=587534 RepID=A0AAE3ZYR7_9ACTN|nr:STAS domain-containing protein [Catenuloplanes niger]MDR7327714.1 anti-sigma B factor antagonist [Catenuloplanes niger]